MTISEQFDQQSWAKRLGRRGPNFKLMCEHVDQFPLKDADFEEPIIIETGTAWDQDNFEGQGQSTIIWNWLANITDVGVHSIDIREEAVKTAQSQTDMIEFHCGDSPKVLSEFSPQILAFTALLYLDSFDWTPELNLASSVHHLCELAAVYARLPSGCMIVVDDRHGNDAGKHLMVEFFFQHLKIEPVFKNCQIGWVKP